MSNDEFLSDLNRLEDKVSDTWDEFESIQRRLNSDHAELQQILNRYKELNKDFKLLRDNYSAQKHSFHNNDIDSRISSLDSSLNSIHENKQRVGSLWLRFLVGRVSMKVYDDNTKIQLKTEYHKFKYRTNFIFILFPILQLIWNNYYGSFSWIINQWHQIWLLYYYITLSTREVILKLNGSKLHTWWIIHHQISSFGSLISILLMRSAYNRYSFIFHIMPWISLLVGILQIFTNYYQSRRHYVRLALGKISQMDVMTGEFIINEKNTSSSYLFIFLKIFCYITYLFELSIGLSTVIYVYWNDKITCNNNLQFACGMDLFQFEAYLCGIVFFILGCGNCYALYTRPSKYMHRSGSRQKLNIKKRK